MYSHDKRRRNIKFSKNKVSFTLLYKTMIWNKEGLSHVGTSIHCVYHSQIDRWITREKPEQDTLAIACIVVELTCLAKGPNSNDTHHSAACPNGSRALRLLAAIPGPKYVTSYAFFVPQIHYTIYLKMNGNSFYWERAFPISLHALKDTRLSCGIPQTSGPCVDIICNQKGQPTRRQSLRNPGTLNNF